MSGKNLKIVIVGHVDHGKSTLIGRLLHDTDSLLPDRMEELRQTCERLGQNMEFAFFLDYLQEEREQGKTIDTAQAFFRADKRDYVIIDAPGHKEFVKNMITGASQAEAAILIVDVTEGVREQTKRHACILSMLGLNQIVAVINKMDMVSYSKDKFNDVKVSLLDFLDNLNIRPSSIIPVSAMEGHNVVRKSDDMKWYSGMTILESLDTFSNQDKSVEGPLIFPVQDVYEVMEKRIFVGRVEKGRLKEGQRVFFLPSGSESIINSVEIFLEDCHEAEAGESVGVTLNDFLFIERGEIICEKKEQLSVVDKFRANIFWMSQVPFEINESISIRCATQEVRCYIERIEKRTDSSTLEIIEEDATKLLPTEVGSVIIKTKSPIVVENFNDIKELGRFVLLQDNDTVAGGIVTHTSDFKDIV